MKRLFFLVFISLLLISASAQNRKKVGVVLSGGGAKGVAHIEALKAIEEAGIPIDYIAGTSMGAIVGGLYSIGYTTHQLDSMVKSQDWSFLLSDRTERKMKTFIEKEQDAIYVLSLPFLKTPKEVIPDGIIKGQNLDNLFTNLTIGYHDSLDFNKLPIPFACVAVDLTKGEEVVFHRGRLSEAMRASMAIPAAFTPVRLDSMVLVDGGLMNNFPVDVALSMGAEIIIGVDVQSELKEKNEVTSLLDMVNEMSSMLSEGKYKQNMKHVDVHIKVDVKGYNAASFNQQALDTLLHRGKIASESKRKELLALKSRIGISDRFVPKQHGPYKGLSEGNPIYIRSISFGNIEGKEKQELMEKCKLTENSTITMEQLQYAINALYGTQVYTNINYDFNRVGDEWNLEFSMENNTVNSFNLGIRFDSEEVASVLLNASYQFKTSLPTKGVVTARFGKRTGVRLDYEILPHPLRFFNLSYSYQYNDINIYKNGSREYNATYDYHLGEIGYSNIFNRNLKLGVGIRYEHYHYENFLYNKNEDDLKIKPEGFFSYYALLRYETTDRKTYPTKGTSLQVDFSLYTDNLFTYNGHSPFAAASIWWKKVFSPTRRFSIIPSAYGRVLMGQEFPYPFLNVMGGDKPGRYVPQQLPFAGIDFMEIYDNSVVVAALRLREQMGKNHYLFFNGNYALTDNDFTKIPEGKSVIGCSLGYGYNSFLGPLEASFNISDSTKKIGFYLNIGFVF